ncbi:MAG: hypothetical protein NXI30_04385 [bacterium]|nr:hypothetical protein [bacterium]
MSVWADPELDADVYRQLIDPTFDPAAEAALAYALESERIEEQERVARSEKHRRILAGFRAVVVPILGVMAFGSLVWAVLTFTH